MITNNNYIGPEKPYRSIPNQDYRMIMSSPVCSPFFLSVLGGKASALIGHSADSSSVSKASHVCGWGWVWRTGQAQDSKTERWKRSRGGGGWGEERGEESGGRWISSSWQKTTERLFIPGINIGPGIFNQKWTACDVVFNQQPNSSNQHAGTSGHANKEINNLMYNICRAYKAQIICHRQRFTNFI